VSGVRQQSSEPLVRETLAQHPVPYNRRHVQLLPDSFVDSLHASHAGEPDGPYLEAGRFVRGSVKNCVSFRIEARPWMVADFFSREVSMSDRNQRPSRWRSILMWTVITFICLFGTFACA
jgi:hypothetical protein